MKEEKWLPLPWDDWYEVSDHGRVRRAHDGHIFSVRMGGRGYLVANINGRPRKVHQLVMLTFVGPYPPDRPHINHRDGVKTNNCLENLEFVTPRENVRHALRLGLADLKRLGISQFGEGHARSKMKVAWVKEARRRAAAGESNVSIGRRFGVNGACISKIVHGRAWAHVK